MSRTNTQAPQYITFGIVAVILFVAFHGLVISGAEPSDLLKGWTDWVTKAAGAVVAVFGIAKVVKVQEQKRNHEALAAFAQATGTQVDKDDAKRLLKDGRLP